MSSTTVASAQQRANPSQQLRERKGLHQVVISAQFQTFHAVVYAVSGRQEKNRHILTRRTDLAQDIPAIEPRHHHVEYQQVIRFALCLLQGVSACHHPVNGEASFCQTLLEVDTGFWLIFGYE